MESLPFDEIYRTDFQRLPFPEILLRCLERTGQRFRPWREKTQTCRPLWIWVVRQGLSTWWFEWSV